MKLALTTITLWALSLGVYAQLEVPVPYNPDGNADGFITLPDLLDFLALYGGEYSPEALATDSSSAIIHMGQGDYFDCASWCAELEGNWKVMDEILVGRYKDQIQTMTSNNATWMDRRSIDPNNYEYAPVLQPDNWSVSRSVMHLPVNCICQTRVIQPIVIQSGPCQGNVDLCGICDGPGPVYECGCFEIPEGACDCEGNQLDALGVCGGDCLGDFDGDGICDYAGEGPCDGLDVLTYQGVDYDIVEIGGRCWFADNLAATHYQDGTVIPDTTAAGFISLGIQFLGAYRDYGASAPGGGYSYNWYALQSNGGVCPSGWHVPSKQEFQDMIDSVYVMDNALSGWPGVQYSLKDTDTFDGDNATGFTATPSYHTRGRYISTSSSNDDGLGYLQTRALYWTTTPSEVNHSVYFQIYAGDVSMGATSFISSGTQSVNDRDNGYDVRCIKDAE